MLARDKLRHGAWLRVSGIKNATPEGWPVKQPANENLAGSQRAHTHAVSAVGRSPVGWSVDHGVCLSVRVNLKVCAVYHSTGKHVKRGTALLKTQLHFRCLGQMSAVQIDGLVTVFFAPLVTRREFSP